MTELRHDLDESCVDSDDEVGHVQEHTGISEMLLQEDDSSEVSKRLPYLLVLTCGGAG